jgi:hypothetical protein
MRDVSPSAESPSSGERLKRQRHIALGATFTVVGLGMVGIGHSEFGGVLSLVGWLNLFFAIHKYGRLGPERPCARNSTAISEQPSEESP